jgi:adenine-specific DNA-methyltransferase
MPPSRVRYNSYYHIWTSICLNDKPKLFGAANRREDSSDKVAGSLFEEFRRDENGKFIVINALEKLIKTTKANYILLSYSTQGRATSKAIKEIIADLGYSVGVVQIDYKKNVMGGMSWTNDWTMDESNKLQELIFVISKIDKKINIQNTKVKQLELDMI